MSTFNILASSPIYYYPCPPDAFGPFKRGGKALCLHDCGKNDWLLTPPPRKGQIYIVRDYHWGNSVTPDGVVYFGQILNLEGVICDRVAHIGGLEWGWHHSGFRKITEAEAVRHVQIAIQAPQ